MMEYQELGYLREELNMRCNFQTEQTGKTINTVLLIWGGAALVIAGNSFLGVSPMKMSLEHIPLYFILATVFGVSNLILYLTAQRHHDFVDHTCKMAAYIALFYEHRPSKTTQIGKNFSWEWAQFEIIDNTNDIKSKKRFLGVDCECAILTLVSTAIMTFFSLAILVVFFANICSGGQCGEKIVGILLFLICVGYIAGSCYSLYIIPWLTSLIDARGMKDKYFRTFIQYALETKHYDEARLVQRFGDGIRQLLPTKNDRGSSIT